MLGDAAPSRLPSLGGTVNALVVAPADLEVSRRKYDDVYFPSGILVDPLPQLLAGIAAVKAELHLVEGKRQLAVDEMASS